MEVESVEKSKIYFSGKVYCRQKQDMITAFFRGISEKDLKRVKELARTQLSTAILNRFGLF